jgi:DNA-binding NtrC family response regulator/tetratricopeptide (TPR) repeat protein
VGFAGAEKAQHSKEIVYEEIAHSGPPRAILPRFSLVVPLALWPGMVRLDIDANVTPLLEAMDHGRDGYPRWIVVETTRRRQLTHTAESITTAAVDRGFVALPIDAYLRSRVLGANELDERTLLLIDVSGGDPWRAHAALLHASAQSPRPHLLLTFHHAPGASKPASVREARASYLPERGEGESPQIAHLVSRASRAHEFAASGRHAAAERLLRDVAAALARRDACRHAARLNITLARLLSERGRTKAAFETLEEAIAQARTAREDDLALEGRIWQAATRIADAAFVEAEALCRAVLEAPRLPPELKTWTLAVLAEALLWQGRFGDTTDFEVDGLSALDPVAAAETYQIKVRLLLAQGRGFEAGRCVGHLKTLASHAKDMTVHAIANIADLALLAASGDLARASQAFGAAAATARTAKTPFRAAWAHLLWVDMLRRAGCSEAARPHLDRLSRLARAAPLLLQREIGRRLSGDDLPTVSTSYAPHLRPSALSVALLRAAHEDEDDKEAIRRLIDRAAHELSASRIDVLSAAAGPVTPVCSVGEGLPTRLGPRVLEAAFPIGPERQAGGSEIGLPVRLGTHVVGAIVCRWPIDRIVPADAAELLELIAVIAAPRLDALLAGRRDEASASTAVPELLGVSDAMANVRKAIVRAAAAPFAVLIEGESGVGKELAARAVHQLSPRRERKFCDVNCAALPEELLESELFGHTRGAFSGAVVDRAGLFEEADGGTLLLDEVADLSSRAQAKLLRAVQQQEVRRVGESFSRKIDVRVVAAANRDMRAEAAAGRFRQDLLYRLDVVRIHIPPLRERPGDIPVLAEHCWNAAIARTGSKARLSPATLAELSRYQWPGNVRELQNVIASLVVAAPHRGWVRPSLLPPVIGLATTVSSGRLAEAREQFERRFVELALARASGNRARAARSLGLSRQGLMKILARLRLDQSSVAAVESC